MARGPRAGTISTDLACCWFCCMRRHVPGSRWCYCLHWGRIAETACGTVAFLVPLVLSLRGVFGLLCGKRAHVRIFLPMVTKTQLSKRASLLCILCCILRTFARCAAAATSASAHACFERAWCVAHICALCCRRDKRLCACVVRGAQMSRRIKTHRRRKRCRRR